MVRSAAAAARLNITYKATAPATQSGTRECIQLGSLAWRHSFERSDYVIYFGEGCQRSLTHTITLRLL
jgi:hypothetical protein